MARDRYRWLLAALVAAAGASALGGIVAWAAPTREREQPGLRPRLRLFARPGDVELTSEMITASIRRADGWLVDMWPQTTRLPTSEQLGTTSDIDALWQFHQVVRIGRDVHPFVAARVRRLPSGVETDSTLRVGAHEYRAQTTFGLVRGAQKVQVTSTFSATGPSLPEVEFGDAVKWGNAQYVVQGEPRPLRAFEGWAGWVGRRGASGDLLLRGDPERGMRLSVKESEPGLAGALHAYHWRGRPRSHVQVHRELSFERLPSVVRPLAPTGTVHFSVVDERERPLAAKLSLTRQGSAEPLFDHDGDVTGADRFIWTGNGTVDRELPVGTYALRVSAGPERDITERMIHVREAHHVTVPIRLPRAFASPGLVATDLHLHQAPSVDADVSLESRVIAVAAEGVEFAVATDHYAVTDLAPTVRWLTERGALISRLQTMVGTEISTVGKRFGHFNAFPLAAADELLAENTSPTELFARVRKQSPGGVLQVNHPRWEPRLGYFSAYDLDPVTGVARVPGFNPAFDTIEVYNGVDVDDPKLVDATMREWLRLLGGGARYAATGSSDSHQLVFHDPGLPRTMVWHGTAGDDDSDAFAPASQIVSAIKQGRSFVTTGPFIQASVAGAGPGEVARIGTGTVPLDLRVLAARWVDVSELLVLVGPSAEVLHRIAVPPTQRSERFRGVLTLRVAAPTFVVIVASGQRPLVTTSRLVRPFAFTNPIWLER